MKFKLIFCKTLFAVMAFIVFSSQGPYGNVCQSGQSYGEAGSATAYFNDSDNDCLSNDFIIEFVDSEGNTYYYDNDDYAEGFPDSGGWYDFDSEFWDCCNDEISGGDGEPDSDASCPCSWIYDAETSFLIVECPDDC